eukprot:m.353006 g.353006  ORF g.353006 m.353006 type:complete len:86 (+) comp16663_c0_seq1:96-353(+)
MIGNAARYGGEGRCYRFWQDFVACTKKNGGEKAVCVPAKEDYLECLHHTKQNARLAKVEAEMKRQQAAGTLPAEVQELLNRTPPQ